MQYPRIRAFKKNRKEHKKNNKITIIYKSDLNNKGNTLERGSGRVLFISINSVSNIQTSPFTFNSMWTTKKKKKFLAFLLQGWSRVLQQILQEKCQRNFMANDDMPFKECDFYFFLTEFHIEKFSSQIWLIICFIEYILMIF